MVIWVFDVNRRVYDEEGHLIWREHWQPRLVKSETTRSWVLSCGTKVPKKGGRGFAFSKQEVDNLVWANDNYFLLIERIRQRKDDYKLLRQIEALLNG